MSLLFPINPNTNDQYSFGENIWKYNGIAWDKIDQGITGDYVKSINGITGPVGMSAGYGISISPTGKTLTVSFTDILYGVSGNIFASNLATGLLHGGIISINAGNSAAFDLTAGRGQIHASGSTYTADPLPLLNYVSWLGQTGIAVTNLTTSDTTWLYIDSAGNLQQRTQYYTDDQIENTIIIGQLVHPSRTYINLARTNPNVAYATDKQYEQFIRAFGPIKISGHTISANGANLKLNRTSGRAFSLGRNWINNTDDPSVVSDGAYTDCIFFRYYRGATAGTFITVPNQTAIDPTKIDNGTGTLGTVPGGKYTIQRLFYYPNTPTLLGVYYGRAEYTSLADAAANINLEEFTEIENTRTNAIFVAYLIVKAGATDLSNTSDALILQAGSFRSTTSGGGSVSLTLDDLTDVIITSPADYQLLTYVDGITGWENKSITTLPLVSSFNGLCGAVTGVSSVNGSTGNITNVAFLNVANTFTSPQTFSSGLTGSKLNVVDQAIIGNSITIPFQSVGNTAQRMNIGVYGTVSETTSSSALIWGNSVAASKQSAQKVEKTTFDIGHYVKMRYDTGISIHTNITGVAGTEYGETQNTRLLVDLNGNVGINTTSPSHKLHVVGNMYASDGATFGSSVNLAAGSSTIAPIKFTSGTNLTSPTAGALEYDGNAYYATVNSGRGFLPSTQLSIATSDIALSNINTAQNVFGSSSDVITLAANTTYLVNGVYFIQSGTVTHTTAISFTYSGTAPTMSFYSLNLAAAVGTVSRAQDMVYYEGITGGLINSTSASARNVIKFEGVLKTSNGGSLTPQITFSAQPGGTNLTKFGSYIALTPVGNDTVTSIGPWS